MRYTRRKVCTAKNAIAHIHDITNNHTKEHIERWGGSVILRANEGGGASVVIM